MDFIAIDFETANRNHSSICQVGLAEFRYGECSHRETWFVDPGQPFEERAVGIHGITAEMVAGSPRFPELLASVLAPRLAGKVVVCHTAYDRVALEKACDLHELTVPAARWLDSATLARRVWTEVSKSGFGLKNLAATHLGVEFRHHDAGEDAYVAGLVVVSAATSLGLTLDECLDLVAPPAVARDVQRVRPRSNAGSREPDEKELRGVLTELVSRTAGRSDPPLAGERVVITGRLQLTKAEVGAAITAMGGTLAERVRADTTMLVVGSQVMSGLNGKTKSSNHLAAEKFQSEGREIRIFMEAEWISFLRDIHVG